MQESVLPKLEALGNELPDLGMRNTVLNYKVPKSRGIQVLQEKSLELIFYGRLKKS